MGAPDVVIQTPLDLNADVMEYAIIASDSKTLPGG